METLCCVVRGIAGAWSIMSEQVIDIRSPAKLKHQPQVTVDQ